MAHNRPKVFIAKIPLKYFNSHDFATHIAEILTNHLFSPDSNLNNDIIKIPIKHLNSQDSNQHETLT